MKRIVIAVSALMLAVSACAVLAEEKDNMSGENLFKEYCAVCHVDGGNIINPEKTLHTADLEANGIRSKADIVHTMRHPGKGMTEWGAATIPDRKAELIADYILKTFK